MSTHEESVTANSALDEESLRGNATVRRLFIVMFIVAIFINFDSGAVPAVLDLIKKDVRFQPLELGLLGGLQYLGLTFMSPLSGYMLQRWHTRRVIGVCFVLNMLSCFFFALSRTKSLLLLARLLIGLTQATIVIYCPVWVDEFSPDDSRTVWMSLMQVATPLGVMIGYTTSGYMAASGLRWQASLILQSCLLVPFTVLIWFVPLGYMDIRGETTNEKTKTGRRNSALLTAADLPSQAELQTMDAERVVQERQARAGSVAVRPPQPGDDPEAARAALAARRPSLAHMAMVPDADDPRARMDSLWVYFEGGESAATISLQKQIRILWRCRIYVLITFALSALFFVVTGVQFWATDYMVSVLNGDRSFVLAAFALTSATGPALGVVFGGWLVDRLGGYRGTGGIAVTARCCAGFAVVAVIMALPAGFVDSIPLVIVLMWLVLFFGGAIMAPATGLVLSSVPESLRANSSAFAMLVYNILGYMMGTFVPGALMQVLVDGGMDNVDALAWGFRLNLLWSVFGLAFIAWAAVYAQRKLKEEQMDGDDAAADKPAFSHLEEEDDNEGDQASTDAAPEALRRGTGTSDASSASSASRASRSTARRMSAFVVHDMDENDATLYKLRAVTRTDVSRARRVSLLFPG